MEPTATLVNGVVTFIHDCNALCGDGITRMMPARRYELGLGWTVKQREPLTLDPSIDCGACPLHGWIKEGRWVGA